MNLLEIAIRNFLANQGLDEQAIDALAQDQNFISTTAEYVVPFLSGPYGTLAPMHTAITDAADDADLVEQYLEGYTKALKDVIDHLDHSVIEVPCECAAITLHTVFDLLKRDLQTRIDEIDDDDLPISFTDFFSLIFGNNTGVVDLEQAEG